MRLSGRWAAVGIATGVLSLGVLAATPALASPPPTISFYTQGASTAQWLPNHSAIQLTVPNASSYAIVVFHHVSSTLPEEAPSFVASTYASGSPRWYIQLSDGPYLFGYPTDPATWNVDGCPNWNSGTPLSYEEAIAALGTCGAPTGSVFAVYIVADSSQLSLTTTSATDVLSLIQYNGVEYTNP